MKNIMILSGAGLSAPSGLKTFRDNDGLWEEYDVMEVCSATGFRKNPKKVLDFYDARRAQLQNVKPNHAHEKIAQLKEKWGKNLFVITQNVDDLLERAGCKDVVHLHGFLPELRCLKCEEIFNIGYEKITDKQCPKCKSKDLRHNIVMFEEQAPAYATALFFVKSNFAFYQHRHKWGGFACRALCFNVRKKYFKYLRKRCEFRAVF